MRDLRAFSQVAMADSFLSVMQKHALDELGAFQSLNKQPLVGLVKWLAQALFT